MTDAYAGTMPKGPAAQRRWLVIANDFKRAADRAELCGALTQAQRYRQYADALTGMATDPKGK